MEHRYITGIDWSGDPGDPSKIGSSKWLVFAAVHFSMESIDQLSASLVRAKKSLTMNPDIAFKYFKSKPESRKLFFQALAETEFRATVLVIDKEAKEASDYNFRPGAGNERLAESISALLCAVPIQYVSNQIVRIDLRRSETKVCNIVTQHARRSLREQRNIRMQSFIPTADHRTDGVVIQVADMVSGWKKDELQGSAEKLPNIVTSRIKLC